VILLQLVERFFQRARHVGNFRELLGRQRVDVLVERVARVEAPLGAVESGHEHGREGDVAVAGRVGEAHLDALRLG